MVTDLSLQSSTNELGIIIKKIQLGSVQGSKLLKRHNNDTLITTFVGNAHYITSTLLQTSRVGLLYLPKQNFTGFSDIL